MQRAKKIAKPILYGTPIVVTLAEGLCVGALPCVRLFPNEHGSWQTGAHKVTPLSMVSMLPPERWRPGTTGLLTVEEGVVGD